jgi:hypothetical protein
MTIKFFSANKTYSLTMDHINKVIEMALTSEKSQGQIVREAIDLLYRKKKFSKKVENSTKHFLSEIKKGTQS